MSDHPWTPEEVEFLREHWLTMSPSQIAEHIGELSANAVIGKAHRLGLPKKPNPGSRKTRRPKASRSLTPGTNAGNVIPFPKTAPDAFPDVRKGRLQTGPQPILFGRKSGSPSYGRAEKANAFSGTDGNECSWIKGEVRGAKTVFCGEPCVRGKPYCAKHCDKAYQRSATS